MDGLATNGTDNPVAAHTEQGEIQTWELAVMQIQLLTRIPHDRDCSGWLQRMSPIARVVQVSASKDANANQPVYVGSALSRGKHMGRCHWVSDALRDIGSVGSVLGIQRDGYNRPDIHRFRKSPSSWNPGDSDSQA